MDRWMDGWMRWMDGWMNGWMNGWIDGGWIDRQIERYDVGKTKYIRSIYCENRFWY